MFDENYHSIHTFFVPSMLGLSKVQVIFRNEWREIRIAAFGHMRQKTCCKSDSPARHLSSWCSHVCHFRMIGPEGTQGASRAGENEFHTHEENKNSKQRSVDTSLRHLPYMSANRMWEDSRRPTGEGFWVSHSLCRPFLTLSTGAEIDGSLALYMAGGLPLT